MNRKLIAHSPPQVHQLRDGIGVVVRRDAHAHAVSHAVVEAKVTRQHVSKLLTLKVGDMLQGYAGHPAGLIDLGTGGDEQSGQADRDQQGKCC